MKRYNRYIVWLIGLALTLTACEKNEPDFFDEDYNGAYFDYQYAAEFETTLNFGEYVVGNPQSIPVTLNVKLLGYLVDEKRTLSIKTKEVEGYALADVIVPEVTFENREYQKNVEVMVKRPEVEDSVFAVCIYLDGEGDLGAGIAGKEEFTIYVKEIHERPSIWSGMVQTYLGNWDREKHAYLANLYNDNYYYNALYNNEQSQYKYNEIIDMNEAVVNTLLAKEPTEPIKVNFPILKAEEYANYSEPYFWSRYSENLGLYSSQKFCKFTHRINAANTVDIIAAYENAGEEMEKIKTDFHKEDVLIMLNEYYNYPKMGYTIDQYKDLLWVKIQKNVDYVNKGVYLRIPYWWEDPDNLGTAMVVKKYFGEYADDKYQFMIKTMMDNDGEDNFVAATILPFTIEGRGFGWDATAGGEERLKECYRIIKAKNDKRPGALKFDIPEVVLE